MCFFFTILRVDIEADLSCVIVLYVPSFEDVEYSPCIDIIGSQNAFVSGE